METMNYRICFLKRTAKLNKDALKTFAIEVLKEFGGLSLLSNLTVSALDENIFRVKCDKEIIKMVQASFITCGCYLENKCRFTQID